MSIKTKITFDSDELEYLISHCSEHSHQGISLKQKFKKYLTRLLEVEEQTKDVPGQMHMNFEVHDDCVMINPPISNTVYHHRSNTDIENIILTGGIQNQTTNNPL